MDKMSLYQSDSSAQSCLIMYRMGGLRHVLFYLKEILAPFLAIDRINVIFCSNDLCALIVMADTYNIDVPNRSRDRLGVIGFCQILALQSIS